MGSLTAAPAGGRLLRAEFTTLCDYLQLLRTIAKTLQVMTIGYAGMPRCPHARAACACHNQACGQDAMFLLAAAVSDFYVPW